jgi:hypothetical protein
MEDGTEGRRLVVDTGQEVTGCQLILNLGSQRCGVNMSDSVSDQKVNAHTSKKEETVTQHVSSNHVSEREDLSIGTGDTRLHRASSQQVSPITSQLEEESLGLISVNVGEEKSEPIEVLQIEEDVPLQFKLSSSPLGDCSLELFVHELGCDLRSFQSAQRRGHQHDRVHPVRQKVDHWVPSLRALGGRDEPVLELDEVLRAAPEIFFRKLEQVEVVTLLTCKSKELNARAPKVLRILRVLSFDLSHFQSGSKGGVYRRNSREKRDHFFFVKRKWLLPRQSSTSSQ